ncbi:MAG TPA: GNAT family N-acetyltransferase [Kofleriaceae bacterium]|jgi:putative acetyltransferase
MIKVRYAEARDAEALIALLKSLVAEPGINIPLAPDEVTLTIEQERELIERLDDSPHGAMFVAVDGDAIVGELSVKAISTRRAVAHVATIGMSVAASHRRRGVGEALLRDAIAWADDNDFLRLELYVYVRNAPAVALYEKLGFAIEGKRVAFIREADAFVDDYVMARLSGAARAG